MSYCRWSSFVNGRVPFEEYFSKTSFKDLAEKYQDEVSDWYIYWDCASGETKDSQMLAIWHTCGETPLFSYPDVKEMYEKDDWGKLEDVMTQREFMRECVKRWLDEVEEEYNQ